MRSLRFVFGLATLTIFSGCATQAPTTQPAGAAAVTAPPTTDELPVYEFAEDILPAKIGIEEPHPAPVRQLVVLDPEAPLTPEERKALGIRKPEFDPLELYHPGPALDTPQSPYDYRLTPMAFGLGGVGAGGHGPRSTYAGSARTRSRGSTWFGPATSASGVHAGRPAAGAVGPKSGVDVGYGPGSGTGSPHSRSRP